MIIDLHTHTFPASDDSFLSIEALIEAAKHAGLDALCLTDHDYFWDEDLVSKLSAKHNFLLLPGSEINTDEGHLLVFGLHRYTFGMHNVSYVKELTEEAGAAVIVAHPYRRRYSPSSHENGLSYREILESTRQQGVFTFADAVEVRNGRGTANENLFSQDLVSRAPLRGVGGSDAHKANDIGTFATKFDATVSGLKDLIAELKGGRFSPIALKESNSPLPAGKRSQAWKMPR